MFDAYHKWLGIPPKDQPPHHYRLLGLELFESDPDVIDAAANRQMTYVRGCATGPHSAISQKLLGEIAAARLCLLNAEKKAAYDATLQVQTTPQPAPEAPPVIDVGTPPVEDQPGSVEQAPLSNEHLKAIVIKSAAWSAGALVCALALGYILFPAVFGRRRADTSIADVKPAPPEEHVEVTPLEPPPETEASQTKSAAGKTDTTKAAAKLEKSFAGTPVAGRHSAPPAETPAVVRVTGMKSTPLELANDWTSIPEFLRGAVVYARSEGPIDRLGGLADLEVLSPGIVFLAASWNVEGGPKREPGAESPEELQRMGWKEAGEISLQDTKHTDRHLVYWRKCAEGESFKLRTRSTLPPFVLVRVDSGSRPVDETTRTGQPPGTETVTISPTPASQRKPVPDAEALKTADRQIKELFHNELAVAKKLKTPPAEKAAIAKKLFDQAVATRDDSAARYSLFKEALELSESAGDASGALKCVEEIERWFEVDALNLRIDTLSRTASVAKFPDPQKLIAHTSLAMVDEALLEGDYEGVSRLLRTAATMAGKVKDRDLSKRIADRKKEVQDAVREYETYQASSQYLAKSPGDPTSNLVTGRFLCFVRSDWSEGLERLKKSGDAAWKTAAEAESLNPTEPASEIALADAWWTVAEASEAPWKQRIEMHAGSWYAQAAAGLTGLEQSRAQKRVQESGYDPQSKVVAEDAHSGSAGTRPRANIYTLRALQPVDVRNSLVRFQTQTRDTDTVGNVLVSLDGQSWQSIANWNAASCARGAANDGWQTVSLGQIPAGSRVRELHVRFDHQSGRSLQLRKVVWSKR